MKLSEKGIAKVNGAMVVVRDYSSVGVPIQVIRGANRIKFEPDDFVSPHSFLESQDIEHEKDKKSHHVVLTLEEAEILTRCAANEFCRLVMEHAPVDLVRQVEVVMYDLVKRIGQAEKENESN